MRQGVSGMRPELQKLLCQAERRATLEERRYLPLVAKKSSRAAWPRSWCSSSRRLTGG